MPYQPKDANTHTKAATTDKQRRLWSDVANAVLRHGGSEAYAIRTANKMVNRAKK